MFGPGVERIRVECRLLSKEVRLTIVVASLISPVYEARIKLGLCGSISGGGCITLPSCPCGDTTYSFLCSSFFGPPISYYKSLSIKLVGVQGFLMETVGTVARTWE